MGDHPALMGVNVLNEPRPADPAALNPFYREVVAAIRAERPNLPIILDAAPDAEPSGFDALEPSDDPLVLYDVHLYEPWDFVTWRMNRGRYAYPGADEDGQRIDRGHLDRALEPVRRWQRRHGVASSRVILGEFGIDRRIEGASAYLADVIDLAEAEGWHWAFYAFRDWQAMDYELGPAPPPAGYWEAEERGEVMALPREPNPMWEVLERGLGR